MTGGACAHTCEIFNSTGVDSPYEAPTSPDVRIDTTRVMPEDTADLIIAHL